MASNLETALDAESLAVLEATLPFVSRFGWTRRAMAEGLRATGRDPSEAEFVFPRGGAELIEGFFTLMMQRAALAAEPQVASEIRLSKRVRAVVSALLDALAPHEEPLRRALAWLMLPVAAPVALRVTARLVDAIWETAADRSEDISWYTKRATLAAILLPTLLFWLRAPEVGTEPALAFFDRRLRGVGRIGQIRARLRSPCGGRPRWQGRTGREQTA